jgi:GTP pyrophosphokinase
MVPLNTILNVGDVVEVITSQTSKGPSWDWLKIVKSSSARVKIRQFFKREMKEENVRTGKAMLEAECKRKDFNLSELLTDEAFLVLASKMSFNSQEEMFASVGYGAVSTNQIIVKLIDYYRKKQPKQEAIKNFTTSSSSSGGVTVKGIDGLLVRFAGCCNPVPGDDIIGFISRGRGVTVHRRDCPNLKNVESDRLIEVKWTNHASNVFNAEIKVIGKTQAEVLASVSAVVAELKLEIVSTNGRIDNKTHRVVVDFNIRLNSKDALEKLINKLSQDSKIDDVYRAVN